MSTLTPEQKEQTDQLIDVLKDLRDELFRIQDGCQDFIGRDERLRQEAFEQYSIKAVPNLLKQFKAMLETAYRLGKSFDEV